MENVFTAQVAHSFRYWAAAGSVLLMLAAIQTPALADSEGIKVHGNWTITISEADGKQLRVIEFSNALSEGGEFLLPQLLANSGKILPREDQSDQAWDIRVIASGLVDSLECIPEQAADNPELVSPLNAASSVGDDFKSIILTRNLQLAAACVNGASYSISAVTTNVRALIQVEQNQSLFPTAVSYEFTNKQLNPVITGILPGQIVAIEVTISFS